MGLFFWIYCFYKLQETSACRLIFSGSSSEIIPFLIKRNDAEFSKEPNNLKNKNGFRYNGLIHNKTVGVEATEDNKGVVLVTKKSRGQNKPGKSLTKSTLKGGQRAVLATISRTMRKNRYRK